MTVVSQIVPWLFIFQQLFYAQFIREYRGLHYFWHNHNERELAIYLNICLLSWSSLTVWGIYKNDTLPPSIEAEYIVRRFVFVSCNYIGKRLDNLQLVVLVVRHQRSWLVLVEGKWWWRMVAAWVLEEALLAPIILTPADLGTKEIMLSIWRPSHLHYSCIIHEFQDAWIQVISSL